jgi:2-hydroxychromene-2-carboxylate isomerase
LIGRFLFDLNSPYAYLAAERVDSVLPGPVSWEPIVFGALLSAQHRLPWSLHKDLREEGQREVELRAASRGLPGVTWPEGWPLDTWSVPALRAATWALALDPEFGRLVTLELFRTMFVRDTSLRALGAVDAAVIAAGGDVDAMNVAIAGEEVRGTLKRATDAAIAAKVHGVPTVVVGEEMFWGDDQLEAAAAVSTRA